MTGDDAALLAALPAWAFAFVLVMARIGAAIALLPGLGEAAPPAMLRVGLALAVTALLLPGIAPLIPPVPEAGMQAAFMVAAEVDHRSLDRVAGAAAGAGAAGRRASSSPTCWASPTCCSRIPELGGQATPIARLFAIAAPLAILMTGLYALPLAALAGSYRLIPPGTLLPAADTAETAVRADRRGVRAWPCASPRRSCWSPSCGTSRPACSPGWCRACRSTSSPCQGRSSAASRCSRCWRPRC